MSKVTFEHIGTTHTNLQTPLVSDLRLFEMELGSGKPVSARGFSDQNSVKLTPWVESRGRSDTYALPSDYYPSRTARDPAGTALGRENPGKFPAILGFRGGETPRRGFWTSLGPVFRVSRPQCWMWVQTKWWKSIP